MRKWILGRGILQSYTEGDAPASNGVAEAGVKFINRRARTLLDNAGIDKAHWPDAVRTAALEQRAAKLGIPSLLAAPFGAKCYVKMKKYKVTAVDDLGPKWMLGRYLGMSADVAGGHVILKANGQFLQTLSVRLGEEPPSIDEVAPPYFVDEDGLPVPVRRVRTKTKPVIFGSETGGPVLPSNSTAPSPGGPDIRSESETGGPVLPSNSTAPSPGGPDIRSESETGGPVLPSSSTAPSPGALDIRSESETGGPVLPSSSTAPSPGERLLRQVQSAVVSLKPIRTDLTNEKADTLIASEWAWDQHHGFDVDSVDTYDSLEFHTWSERENIWRGVEEEQDAVLLECPLRLCHSRDRITDAWAKVEKVKRSPDEHRCIFWFVECVEHQRIWVWSRSEGLRFRTRRWVKTLRLLEIVGLQRGRMNPRIWSQWQPLRRRSRA